MVLQALVCLVVVGGADWSVQVDRPDLTVWSRDNEVSGLREIKAKMLVDATPARVWTVLSDVEKHTSFMPHLLESRVVDREDDGAVFLYQRISPPMVDDRDYTVRVQNVIDVEHATYKQTWTTANHRGPAGSDAVRLARVDGSWHLEPAALGGTWVTYWVHTSPGGSIPRWIVNAANKKGIPELMVALKARVTGATSSR